MSKKSILDRLSAGVVLGDGGYIVELEQRGWVVTGAFTPEISITHPGAVRELHEEMKNAGCDVLQVMAFYGSRGEAGNGRLRGPHQGDQPGRDQDSPGGSRRRSAGSRKPEHDPGCGSRETSAARPW